MKLIVSSLLGGLLSLFVATQGNDPQNALTPGSLVLYVESSTPGEIVQFEGTVAVGFEDNPSMVHVSATTPYELTLTEPVFLALLSAEAGKSIQARVAQGESVLISAGGPRVVLGDGLPPRVERFASGF